MSMQPFIGFRPDIDPTTPGVITDCDDLLPTVKGFKAMPAAVGTVLPALAAECIGSSIVTKLDGTNRFFAGTATRIYEASTSSWTDRSEGGAAYTSGTFWRFAQFGDTTIAVNKTDDTQASSSGAFAAISGAPKASFVDAAAGFVMLGATNDGTYGDSPDRWWCSSYQDATSGSAWTPDVTTQCTTGRIVDAPGPITGGIKALGSNFVAYKAKSMFLGTYVGAPAVFSWQQIPGEIGCSSPECVVNIGVAHVFVSNYNIYIFDGTVPKPIGDDIKEFFFRDLNKTYRGIIRGMHEISAGRVWFFYPSGISTSCDKAIVYNYISGKWGKVSLSIEFPVEYISPAITYANLGDYYATWDDIAAISYDSEFWSTSSVLPAFFNTSHTLKSLNGVSDGCSITCGDLGDDTQLSLLTRSRPRFVTVPTSGTMTNYYRDSEGSALTLDATSVMNSGKFDALRTARWHRLKYDFVGDCEIIGDVVSLQADGFS